MYGAMVISDRRGPDWEQVLATSTRNTFFTAYLLLTDAPYTVPPRKGKRDACS